uniref:RAMP superfamily CRISPR-associated protein n=1 Tax=Dietzia sp. SYD-A1 TaxID=2780141 RepID=UPI001E446386
MPYSTSPHNNVPFGPPRTARALWNLDDIPADVDLTRCMDRPVAGTHSGDLVIDIRVLSALYIGGDPDGHSHRFNGTWSIPGSAIRGLARNSLAILLGQPLRRPDRRKNPTNGDEFAAPIPRTAQRVYDRMPADNSVVWGRGPLTVAEGLSATQALLGDISDTDPDRAVAGRLRFHRADVCTDTVRELEARPVRLLGPHLQADYLRADRYDPKADDPEAGHPDAEATYLGPVMYHHRGWLLTNYPDTNWRDAVNSHHGGPNRHPDERTSTIIRPLVGAPGNPLVFRGKISFSNLTTTELALLLFALDPNSVAENVDDDSPPFAHHLGQGAPLGLGAVRLTPGPLTLQGARRALAVRPPTPAPPVPDPTSLVRKHLDTLV